MTPSGPQAAWNRSTAVPSPCINVCQIEPLTQQCTGCLRTLDEITAWGTLNDAARRAVWALLDVRRAAADAHKPTTGR